jgi:hypothetical protein
VAAAGRPGHVQTIGKSPVHQPQAVQVLQQARMWVQIHGAAVESLHAAAIARQLVESRRHLEAPGLHDDLQAAARSSSTGSSGRRRLRRSWPPAAGGLHGDESAGELRQAAELVHDRAAVDQALRYGRRNLPGGSSLAKLLVKAGKKVPVANDLLRT